MQENEQDEMRVISLLEDIRFQPSTTFEQNLHDRLINEINKINSGGAPDNTVQPKQDNHWLHWFRPWRLAASSLGIALLAFAVLCITVPTVRAQVAALARHFGISLPWGEGLVISGFEPLAPEGIPPQMTFINQYSQLADGPIYTELRYFGTESFIVIYEAPLPSDDIMPEGEAIKIGNYDAILQRDLNGMIFLAAQSPQPWRIKGSGGGGGGGDDSAGAPPQMMPYSSAIQLTWVQSNIHIELLTNLSLEEALRLAETMHPAKLLKDPGK